MNDMSLPSSNFEYTAAPFIPIEGHKYSSLHKVKGASEENWSRH